MENPPYDLNGFINKILRFRFFLGEGFMSSLNMWNLKSKDYPYMKLKNENNVHYYEIEFHFQLPFYRIIS